jgi:hypothetical protein
VDVGSLPTGSGTNGGTLSPPITGVRSSSSIRSITWAEPTIRIVLRFSLSVFELSGDRFALRKRVKRRI